MQIMNRYVSIGPWVQHNHHKSSRLWSHLVAGGPAIVVFNREWWAFDVCNAPRQGKAESHEAAQAAADDALAHAVADWNDIIRAPGGGAERFGGDRVVCAGAKSISPWACHNHHKSSRMWSPLIYDGEYGQSGGGPAAVVFNQRWWAWDMVNNCWSGVAESHAAAQEVTDKVLAVAVDWHDKLLACDVRDAAKVPT